MNVSRALVCLSLGFSSVAVSARAAEQTSSNFQTQFYGGLLVADAGASIWGTATRLDGTTGPNALQDSPDISLKQHGFGVFTGFGVKFSSGLYGGVEADWMKLVGSATNKIPVLGGNIWNGQTQDTLSYRPDWLATLRPRLGWSFRRVLAYTTGGLALSSETHKRTQFLGDQVTALTNATFTEESTRIRAGVTLGAGVEYEVTDKISMKAEYLRVFFPAQQFSFPNARGGVVPTVGYASVQGRQVEAHSRANVVRIGAAYKF